MAYQETPAARLRALRQRWEADRTSRVFLQLAEEYRRQGMPREALPVLEEGLRHHSSSIAGQVALGRCRLELGQAEGAAAILEKVVERDPTQMVAYRTLVDAYTKLGAPNEARDRLSHYAQLNPQDPEIESLDGQIAVLERAWASGTLPPQSETMDPAGATEPSGEPPSSPISQGSEEMVAALWPAQPPEAPLARAWSTSIDAGWITPSPAGPPAGHETEPASLSQPSLSPSGMGASSGMPASDEPTDVFSLRSVPPRPEALEPDTLLALAGEPAEPATVQLSLDEMRRSGAIPPSASWTHRADDGSLAWLDANAASAPKEALPPGSWNGAYEPEDSPGDASPGGNGAEIGEPLEDGAGFATAPAALEPQPVAPRSWSIGESEIVFSLPATPLLRLVDLALVPWRPLATPAWSRTRGAAVPAGIGSDGVVPSPPSTPTLAQLYLEQGHAEEAAEMFEQVLEREPDNLVARAGLERVERERVRVTARSLLGDFDTGGGLSAKQAHVLRRWAALLREAHRRDAP